MGVSRNYRCEWGLSDIGYWVGLSELVDIKRGCRNE